MIGNREIETKEWYNLNMKDVREVLSLYGISVDDANNIFILTRRLAEINNAMYKIIQDNK